MYKILYVNHVGHISGAERVLMNLLSRLDRKKFEPIVTAPADGTFLTEITTRGFKMYPINTPLLIRSKNPFRLIKYIPDFWKTTAQLKTIIKQEKIDLIHANSFTAMLYSNSAVKSTGKPIIWHMHDIITPRWFNRRFITYAGRGATKIVAVSNAVKSRLIELGVPAEKCITLYNGMDCSIPVTPDATSIAEIERIRKELQIPQDAIVISMFGQIAQWKGQAIFIQAAAKLVEQYPQLRFLIIGDIIHNREQKYKRDIEQLITQLHLSSPIIFTGFRRDVPNLMRMSDIIVHCSVMPDPLPTVILEAMVSKKPVIAARVGGVPEIVQDGLTGLLFTSQKTDELVNAMRQLVVSKELRQIMGNAGRNRVEQFFNINQNIEIVQTIYSQLLLSK
jgi:glycosyltransferase involved in cell wall biosynthesis